MNSHISIGQGPAQIGSTSQANRQSTGNADAFAGLLDLIDAMGLQLPEMPGNMIGQQMSTLSGQDISSALQGLLTQDTELTAIDVGTTDTLSTSLTDLLAKLAELAEPLDGEDEETVTLDSGLFGQIDALLTKIDAVLGEGGQLPAPGQPGFAALTELAASLGLKVDGDSPTSALDTLSALSSKLAALTKDDAPELSAKLAELSKNLDAHTAAIQSALADAEANATGAARHIEAGTQQNPAQTIAQSQTPEAKAATQPGTELSQDQTEPSDIEIKPGSERRLSAGPDDKPATGNGNPSNTAAQANAASAAAAAVSKSATPDETDAPDGLTIQASLPQTQPGHAGAAIRPEAAAYQRPDTQLNLPYIAAEITRQVQNGMNRFEIRLNPPEMGRIDVQMDIDDSGNVVARLAVEKSETLDLLQRDQRALMKALADAGLDGSKTNLEFSLQQETGQGNAGGRDEPESWKSAAPDIADAGNDTSPKTVSSLYRGYARADAVNLWV